MAINPPNMVSSLTGLTWTFPKDFRTQTVSLDCCKQAQSPVTNSYDYSLEIQKEKDTAMTTQYDEIASQRKFLKDRAYIAWRTRTGELRKEFYIDEDEFPSNPKEFVKRIQDGAYRIRKPDTITDTGEEVYYDRVTHYFEWRAKDPDRDGYKVAVEKLDKEYQKLMDTIILKSPDDGYAALEAWETTGQTAH